MERKSFINKIIRYMKKKYISPCLVVTRCQCEYHLLKASGLHSKDSNIPYGGIDDNGTLVPGSRRKDLWEADEDEEEYYQ